MRSPLPYYRKKIFSRRSGRMNFFAVRAASMTAPDAVKVESDRNSSAYRALPGRERRPFSRANRIIEEPDQVGGVFEHVRPDDPVVGVAATDEFYVGPAVPNEIDPSMFSTLIHGAIFFDQCVFVAMVRARERENRAFRAIAAQPAPISKPQPSRLMCAG